MLVLAIIHTRNNILTTIQSTLKYVEREALPDGTTDIILT